MAYLEQSAEWLLQKAFRMIQECRQNSVSKGKNSAIKVTFLEKSLYLERALSQSYFPFFFFFFPKELYA